MATLQKAEALQNCRKWPYTLQSNHIKSRNLLLGGMPSLNFGHPCDCTSDPLPVPAWWFSGDVGKTGHSAMSCRNRLAWPSVWCGLNGTTLMSSFHSPNLSAKLSCLTEYISLRMTVWVSRCSKAVFSPVKIPVISTHKSSLDSRMVLIVCINHVDGVLNADIVKMLKRL